MFAIHFHGETVQISVYQAVLKMIRKNKTVMSCYLASVDGLNGRADISRDRQIEGSIKRHKAFICGANYRLKF